MRCSVFTAADVSAPATSERHERFLISDLHRAEMRLQAELNPPRKSTLIAMLAVASPFDREAIIRQLEPQPGATRTAEAM